MGATLHVYLGNVTQELMFLFYIVSRMFCAAHCFLFDSFHISLLLAHLVLCYIFGSSLLSSLSPLFIFFSTYCMHSLPGKHNELFFNMKELLVNSATKPECFFPSSLTVHTKMTIRGV